MISFPVLAFNLCTLKAGNASAYVSSVQTSGDVSGEILLVLKDIVGGGDSALESAINAVSISAPLSIDTAFQELRGSPACTGSNPIAFRAVQLFGDFDVSVDSRSAIKKIILAVTYPKITPPDGGRAESSVSNASAAQPVSGDDIQRQTISGCRCSFADFRAVFPA
jgi:hypothetical protein